MNCVADLDSPCDCPACEDYREESMQDALRSYTPSVRFVNFTPTRIPIPACLDCGGDLDEYDRCEDCLYGHGDCEIQECFPCYERAIGRAEDLI